MRLALLILLLLPATAHANEVVTIVGYAVTVIFPEFAWVGYVLMVGASVYGANQARKEAQRQQDLQRAAYNSSLKDRMVTRIATDAPYRYIYGKCRVGSDIVNMLTYGDKDQYRYIVCVHAAHECQAIDEIYIAGKALGTLTAPDGNGYQDVTSGDFYLVSTTSVSNETHSGTSFNLAHTPVAGSLRVTYFKTVSDEDHNRPTAMPFTLSGTLVTVAVSHNFRCHYDWQNNTSMVRVCKHLGGAADPVDPLLTSLFPTLWPVTAVLRGFCYTVVMLNLNQPEFQGGPVAIEPVIRGKKLFDPRNSTTYYSDNPALVIYDYLTSELCGVAAARLPTADYITAANLCDPLTGGTYTQVNDQVTVTLNGHGLLVNDIREMQITSGASLSGHFRITGKTVNTFTYTSNFWGATSGNVTVGGLYTCNGTVTSAEDPRKVLSTLAACMGGEVVGTTFNCWAGTYVAPVMALAQSDVVGSLSTLGGSADADLFNGVKGVYSDPANLYVITDYKPYQKAAYVATDGAEKWTGIDFPFTNQLQRVQNLCRILSEDQRNGFTLKAVFSQKAWALKVGQRITFTSAFLGQSSKIYRITDKIFSPVQGVELTLKEDAAVIWNFADEKAIDVTPNTNLLNPFFVGLCGNVQMVEVIYETTGSVGVRSKATVSWDAPANTTIMDYELEYKSALQGVWVELANIRGTSYDFYDLAPGDYDFRVKARNIFGGIGSYTSIKSFTVYGLTAAPLTPTGFSVAAMAGMALLSWDKTVDLDVKIGGKVVVRFCPLTVGAAWEKSIVLEEFNGDAVGGVTSLATGTYYLKFVDSTGHYSDTPTSFVATEALVTGWTTTLTSTQSTAFAGAKTGVVAVDGILKLDSVTMWDSLAGMVDDLAYVDSLGGVQTSGEYLFDATLDMTTKAARRFIVTLQTLSFDAADLIGQRGLVSTWPSVGGGALNDCDVTLYAQVSDDDVTYGPWTPFMVADFNCRYAKLKAVLSSGLSPHNIQVSQMVVTVKTPA